MAFLYIVLSILLPLLLNLLLTPIIITIAHKNSLFDAKDHRKTHVGNIPRLGSLGFITATIVGSILIYVLTDKHVSIAFYIAITIIFISGIIDDFKPIRAYVKLIAQVAATITLLVGGHVLNNIFIPLVNINLDLGIFSYPITFIWIIGITNAINLLDGMDGLAGGVSTIAAATLGITALILGQFNIAITCFILAGALIGFLVFNLPPAKIFMGDGGSLTIGFFLAAIPLLFKGDNIRGEMILVTIAILLIPIIDVFAAIIRRTRDNISFFHPDRGHIHHKFTDFTALNIKQILLIIYSLSILSGVLAILFITNNTLITQLGLFINLSIHLILFGFLHYRKVSRS